MNISLLLNTHQNSPVFQDTLDSVLTHVTKDALVIVDGVGWQEFENYECPASVMCGFRHGVRKSPYRNMALGMKMMSEKWPESDWFCYSEYDVLFASDKFKANLKAAEEKEIWMMGNDGHIDDKEMPLIESMLGGKFRSYYYLLGCCQFFHKNFIKKLNEIEFFDRFLGLTNQFTEGQMPGYSAYDVSEHLYPSLCRQFGGNIGVFASYDERGQWHGHYRSYPMRFTPQINAETENFPEATIIHPVKDYDHPIRVANREIRKCIKTKNQKSLAS